MNKHEAEQWLGKNVRHIYSQLADGMDVSPSARLRLEGQVDLLIYQKLLDKDDVRQLVAESYRLFFKQPVDNGFWQWADDQPVFVLPYRMHEAPVYKAGK